ncbi:hypothetical protein Tco_0909989 [Tanacetum coccineum]|uniref:Uncharacterized protein n=1 Tax=Tanacetum coccineum TaxID=301880 RepID=A0ABQ5CXX0_9ASTR
MRDEAQTATSSIAQLSALIVELEAMEDGDEEKIAMKEEHVKIMEAAGLSSYRYEELEMGQLRYLEALGQRGDALKSLDYLREMVVCDSGMLGVLEQLLAGSHVGMPMKDGYPVTAENKANKAAGPKEANHSAGTQDNIDAGNSKMETEPAQEYFVLPLYKELASPKQTALGKDFLNPLMVDSLPKTIWLSMHQVIAMKHWLFQIKWLLSQKSSSSSKSRLKNSYVFGYILQVINKLKLKKHEVSTASTSVSTGSRVSTVSISLDLSRLATTLNRLERSIQIGINKWYQSLLRNSE